jgi:hypothetical protein
MTFNREPAAIGAVVIAVVSVFATWPNTVVDGDNLPLIIAIIDGVVALAVAWAVRPIAPSLIIAITTPLAALLAGYGVDLPPALIGVVNTLLVPALLGLVARQQQTPKASPATTPGVGGTIR